jgi:hypothetical protein
MRDVTALGMFAAFAHASSRDVNDDRLCEKKRLAIIEAELNVAVGEHTPSREAAGDELADIPHHERFRGIGMNETGGCIALNLAGARPPLPRLCAGH